MSERSTRDPIEYLLNAMEHAGHADKPAEHGYADKRRSVLDAIRTLRVERDAARASLARLQQAWAENAPAVRYKQERDEAREALREYLEARKAPFPLYISGPEAQQAWGERIGKAEARARAILAKVKP